MLIAARNGMLGGKRSPLPPGARWVEYLESTGTQWIDTGVESTNVDTIFEATFAMRNIPIGNSLFGADSISTGVQSGKIVFTQVAMNTNTFYTTKLVYTVGNNRQIYVNGEFAATASNYHAVFPIRLFAFVAHIPTIGSFLISGVKITMNGILVRDFRPIAIDNTGYMLDLVSGEYLQYGNAGTGDFVIGPDK